LAGFCTGRLAVCFTFGLEFFNAVPSSGHWALTIQRRFIFDRRIEK
jgi:hypothetical protein